MRVARLFLTSGQKAFRLLKVSMLSGASQNGHCSVVNPAG